MPPKYGTTIPKLVVNKRRLSTTSAASSRPTRARRTGPSTSRRTTTLDEDSEVSNSDAEWPNDNNNDIKSDETDNANTDDDESQHTQSSAAGSGTRSAVWAYCEQLPKSRNPGAKRAGARCIIIDKKTNKVCGKEFHTSTTNLWKHAEGYHKITDPKHTNRPSRRTGINPEEKRRIDQALVRWIYHDFQSFRVVSNKMFRSLLRSLRKNYTSPGRLAVSKQIQELFIEGRQQLKDLLKKGGSRIALTCDYWSSINRLSFLVVTGHWFSEDRKTMYNVVLDFLRVPPPHDGDRTYQALKKLTTDLKIAHRIMSMTADNATNLDAAVDLWKLEQPYIIRIRCAAHVLNLVCQEGVSELQEMVSAVRVFAKMMKHDKAWSHFQKVQKKQRPKRDAIRVLLDVTTRWNSTFLMLDVAFQFRNGLDQFADTYPNMTEYKLNAFQWDEIGMFVALLKPFYEATLDLYQKQKPTISKVLPIMNFLIGHLEMQSAADHPEIEQAVEKMQKKFEIYWDKVHLPEVLAATVLDPRSKMHTLVTDEREVVLPHLQQTLERYEASPSQRSQRPSTSASSSIYDRAMQRAKARASAFSTPSNLATPSASTVSLTNSHLDSFVQSKSVNSHLDPVDWWNKNGNLYGELQSVAYDHLVIPATAIASEQTNSGGRMLVHYTRSKMFASTIRACICLKSWESTVFQHDPDEGDEEWAQDEVQYDSDDEEDHCWSTTDTESFNDDVFGNDSSDKI